MIDIKEAVIVEGKYDKMKLKPLINTTIIETNGFRIFAGKEKVSLIKQLAEKQGIIVLTDSDSAGFLIRNHLRGIIPNSQIKHAYIPQIKGKEKRKDKPSKEGTLGVEGIDENLLLKALQQAGATCGGKSATIKKGDMYNLGLTGRDNSKALRTALLKKLDLPTYITNNALLDVLNSITSLEQLEVILNELEI